MLVSELSELLMTCFTEKMTRDGCIFHQLGTKIKDKAVIKLQNIGTGGYLEIPHFIWLPGRMEKGICPRSNESLVKPCIKTMDSDF